MLPAFIQAAATVLYQESKSFSPITFVASTSNTGGGSSIVVNRPTGVQTDDLLFATITIADQSTTLAVSVPANWNAVYNTASNNFEGLFWHVAGSSEPASWTFSFTGTGDCSAYVCGAWRFADSTTISAPTNNTGSGTSFSGSAINPSVDNCLIVASVGEANENIGLNANTASWSNLTIVDSVCARVGSTAISRATASLAYTIQTTKTSVNPAGAFTQSSSWRRLAVSIQNGS